MLFILDRDGVINFESEDYIKSPDEWHAIPGSLKAIAMLTQAGHQIAVATNQSGVGRKLFSDAMLKKIHQKMLNEVEKSGGKINKIYYCPHTPNDYCDCRKPKTGLLKEIFKDFKINPADTILIGDNLRDLEAGANMGCQLILVKTGHGELTAKNLSAFHHDVLIFDNLLQAVNALS
ncbi:MAG: D-glycero-beta-D-manno-heptose-1,7-bisphosphate 7-phosphatase [Gammaproteobacteria bacterium RIFCSPHIGHO2_12_FULL_38_11]|nr:MAG: D-glycero-beta-D-manno-heptose-1,7-bisphosphate 7-phosphatase [Gammaproteobacteria bacterium RIFCSPHIGHO2_12_FULL_38_11]